MPHVRPLLNFTFTKLKEEAKSLPLPPEGSKRMFAAVQLTELEQDRPQFLILIQDVDTKTGNVTALHYNKILVLDAGEIQDLIKDMVEKL